ncbi:MAG: hypothetical protein ACLP9L_10235 [Thermoguttaceae bacterium]
MTAKQSPSEIIKQSECVEDRTEAATSGASATRKLLDKQELHLATVAGSLYRLGDLLTSSSDFTFRAS